MQSYEHRGENLLYIGSNAINQQNDYSIILFNLTSNFFGNFTRHYWVITIDVWDLRL